MAYGDNKFIAIIGMDGTIYEDDTIRKHQKMGIDNQRENDLLNRIEDMQKVIDNWRPKMIEHGYIIEEKTAEQIALEQVAEQSEINKSLMYSIQKLTEVVAELKIGGMSNDVNTIIDKNGDEESGNSTSISVLECGDNSGTDKETGERNKTSNSKRNKPTA